MENISLDQYIKNKKSTSRNGNGSGGRARRLSSDTFSKGSPRKLQIRNTLKNGTSSPVKFTARLDTTPTTSNRGGVRSPSLTTSRPPRSTTTTSSLSTSSNITNPPPLKITIQNSTFKKEPRIDRQSIPSGLDGGRDIPRIKITKTLDRNSSLGRPIIRSLPPIRSNSSNGGRIFRDDNNNNNNNSNNNSPILNSGRRDHSIRSGGNRFNNNINNNSDYLSGSGPSLFERSRSINNNHNSHHGGQTGKNLQLFTGSRLNISNLHHAISENDLRVLFDSIGDIKQIKISYDHSGRSDGTGFVIFSRHNDAMTALKKYNGAQLDGKPLRISAGPSLQEDVRNIF